MPAPGQHLDDARLTTLAHPHPCTGPETHCPKELCIPRIQVVVADHPARPDCSL
jgi:hypothetical protein